MEATGRLCFRGGAPPREVFRRGCWPRAMLDERLRSLLERGEREAARRGQTVLVSATVAVPHVDPLDFFARSPAGERAFWEQPGAGFALAAAGAAQRWMGSGGDRFAQVAAGWRHLLATAIVEGAASCPLAAPVCLAGFAFDTARKPGDPWRDYPDALLLLPQFLLIARGGASWLAVNALVEPGGDAAGGAAALAQALEDLWPSALGGEERSVAEELPADLVFEEAPEEGPWKEALGRIVGEIRRGAIEKVVLAREVRVGSRQVWDPVRIVGRLRAGYADCTIFAFERGGGCFVGATPERLVRLEGRTVQAGCLAGTRARGASEEEDRRLGEALLADRKEGHEHALVVRALREALAPLCSWLEVPARPSIRRMPNVQHLYTPLRGRLAAEVDILELVARLHPTPAAGGLPREAALPLIRACEPFDRGWYAGPLGWVDGRGDGEFVVGIRSALLRGSAAFLYAGCGIVGDSDPDLEFEESRLKLQPMLWALNGK